MSDALRDLCIILGIIFLSALLAILGVWISSASDNASEKVDSKEILRMRMRDVCLPGMIERGEFYKDGKHLVICTDGDVRWVKIVQWAEEK